MKKINANEFDPEQEPDGEKLHRVAKIGLGSIPVAGPVVAEIFASIFESPLAKRRTQWMHKITEVVNDLVEEGVLTEKDLQENEVFISTVSQACVIALRNHQEEKLDALRNAVKNSAIDTCPEEDYRQLFLNFIDVCTVTHIKLLNLFSGPEAWGKSHGVDFPTSWSMGGITQVIEHAYPSLQGQQELYEPIFSDLYQRGLVNTESLGTTMSRQGMMSERLTPMGRRLLRFIS